MHLHGIIHKNLRAESVYVVDNGIVKLTDYWLSRPINSAKKAQKAWTCIAPEVAKGQEFAFSSDWWALGILLYVMMVGELPFPATATLPERAEALEKISDKISLNAAGLIQGLLRTEPGERLGNCGIGEITSHPFFTYGLKE